MQTILCTHHKGGVGKTELAIHLSGVLRSHRRRTLLMDCDGQGSAWKFHLHAAPDVENEPRRVDDWLSLLWNRKRIRLKELTEEGSPYDALVIDLDTALENAAQIIVQYSPGWVFVPINAAHEAEALESLPDTLSILADLESKAGYTQRVRIVPLGVPIAPIRERLSRIERKPTHCILAPRVRKLERETRQSRAERRYAWEYAGCEDLKGYYQSLLEL